MLLEPLIRRRIAPAAALSSALHLIAIPVILLYGLRHPVRIVNSGGTQAGPHIDLVYMPQGAAVSHPHLAQKSKLPLVSKAVAPAKPLLPELTQLPLPPVAPPPAAAQASGSSSPSSASSASGQTMATNTSGLGDPEQIALTTYSPSPAPDLSAMPRGTQGDVIVDVTISADGKVSDLMVVKTLGYGIESSVVDTVRNWTFHPATKNGVPVASVQELLFHFARPQRS